MVEKAKKRFIPLLLTIMIAVLLAASGIGILGVDYARASSDISVGSSSTNGEAENVAGTAAYSSPTGTDSRGYKYWNFAYTGAMQSLTGLPAGYYQLQVWGASGGNDGAGYGGLGGYSSGVYQLTAASTDLYVGVGGAGASSATGTGGGWNGGGNAGGSGSSGGGGGATHISKTNNTIAGIGSGGLANILIVAGGGGGAGNSYPSATQCSGAPGGGTSGITSAGGGGGGTQSGGGSGTGVGTFGKGGDRGASNDGGAGGGGLWGGGSSTGDGGGGGGSGYVANLIATTTLGVARVCTAGNAAFPNTTINTTTNETGHSGNGYARITQLNTAPKQSSVPTIALKRDGATTITLTSSLNLSDTESNTIVLKTAGVYMSAATTTPANTLAGGYYNVSWSASAGATSFTVTALRWWSGTKTFYVNVCDKNGSYDLGSNVWVAFNATCSAGTMTQSTTGPNDTLAANKFKYGSSNTQLAREAETSGKILNPVGNSRRTLYLSDALKFNSYVTINVGKLFTKTLTDSYDKLAFSTTVTYGTTRYNADTASTSAAAAQTISSAVSGATDSSYFTEVAWDNAVTTTYYNNTTTQTNYERGKATIKLKSKGKPAGNYYYYITLTVNMLDNLSGTVITSQTLDVVYKVDNTRPKYTDNELYYNLAPGQKQDISLASICTDPDGNALTIVDVKVAEREIVLLDKYGNKQPLIASTNYNVQAAASYASNSTALTTDAYVPGTTTGFKPDFIYQMGVAGADATLVPTQTQGDVHSAYIGYYVNTARNTISIVGNKASRFSYNNATKTNGSTRTSHFYIMVKVRDAGEPEDNGIWFPIAVSVTAVAPKSVVTPSISGAPGSVHYLTPFGILQQAGTDVYGIGTPMVLNANDTDNETATVANALLINGGVDAKGNSLVRAFSYDSDNYSFAASARTVMVGGKNITIPASDASNKMTYAQRDVVFLNNSSTINDDLFRAYTPTNAYDDVTDVKHGFKEFFTVSKVDLYAPASIISGLTDSEIVAFASNGTIEFVTLDGKLHVKYQGLKFTLNKYTMGSYIKISTEVVDAFGLSTVVPIAVNVQSSPFDYTSARSGASFNTRGGKVYTIEPSEDEDEHKIIFGFDIQVGDEVAISPYDLFYNNDTYRANIFNASGDILSFNTVPHTTGHSTFMQGVNKKITVITGSTAAAAIANTTATTDFGLKKLYVAEIDRNPVVSGKGIFGNVEYRAESKTAGEECSEYFVLTGISRTPENGYISFLYVVTTSAGDSMAAEIRVRVVNSLPVIRNTVGIINLSATVALGNSSLHESHDDVDDQGNPIQRSYFIINSNTYNVREYTLNDLFYDVDGDSVKFSNIAGHLSGDMQVGTKDITGAFIPFTADQNVFIEVYVGAGTNNRAGNNNCLIIKGLSSTQGVPGGVWLKFYVTDDAMGTRDDRECMIQIEVHNSLPVYADMVDDNAMENVAEEGEDPSYLWRAEYDTTKVITNRLFDADGLAFDVKDKADNPVTRVAKPMYIVSNDKVMGYYSDIVNKRLADLGKSNLTYSYAPWQVRTIAQDADGAQGLVLYASGYNGSPTYNDVQTFNVTVPGDTSPVNSNSAVAVNDFIGRGESYLRTNRIVQILYFDDNGNLLDEYGNWFRNPNDTETAGAPSNPATITNNTTNWIVALNFVDIPTQNVNVSLRLRDSNVTVSMPAGAQNATTGGHTVGLTAGYAGLRQLTADKGAFTPTANLSGLYNNNGLFSFSIKIRANGIYDNMSRFASNDVVGGFNMNNTWSAKDTNEDTRYYNEYFASADYAPFRYETVSVPSTLDSLGQPDSVAIPISYLSYVSDYAKGPRRGAAQTLAAYYDVDEFGNLDKDTVFDAFTLSDGYHSWTGEDLYNGNCPYVKFELTNNMPSLNSPYLLNQQRFYIEEENGSEVGVEIPVAHANGVLIEDRFGFIITKNKIRSVSNLKLTVRMTLWQADTSNVWTRAEEHDPIVITLPIKVENTYLDVIDAEGGNNKEYDITTTARDGYTVMLSTNVTDDASYGSRANYVLIGSNSAHDQATFTESGNEFKYREDSYFAANSLNGRFTLKQLEYINEITEQSADSGVLAPDAYERIKAYFGVGTVAGVNSVADAYTVSGVGANATATLISDVKEKINPDYLNYFIVSPAGSDSKSVTIEPVHITSFEYTGMSREEIIAAAAQRGLKVDFTADTGNTVKRIYYPLKVLVYDRLTVGNADNTTDFFASSFDVITLNIEIRNSAPVILTRNMSNTIDANDGKKYPGRLITLAVQGSVTYRLSELVSDPDMVYNDNMRRYMHESEVKASPDSVIRDTGDYLHDWGGGALAKIEFMSEGLIGAVSCDLDIDTDTVTITVNSRINGYKQSDIAALIKLTFADRYYKSTDENPTSCSAVIEVHIANKAPTLTTNAERVRNITMHAGEYFTLYTTPYSDFISGYQNSATVGNGVAQGEDGKEIYNGTYFEDVNSRESWNSAYIDAPIGLDNQKESWVYSDMAGSAMESFIIGQDAYMGDASKVKRNLGYMPIAKDDAPWTLRIDESAIGNDNGKGGVYISPNGAGMISYDKLNYVRFEGESNANGLRGYTAVMFEALGACEDVTVSVTLTDGHKDLDDNPLCVVYTFKITVETSKPEAITDYTERNGITPALGSVSLTKEYGQEKYEGRLIHNEGQSDNVNVYDLKMKVGESISLKTGDFVYDRDRNDTEVLYLLGRNGNDPFEITSADDKREGNRGTVTNVTPFISLSYEPGTNRTTRNTKFTVTALNYHNDSVVDQNSQPALLYETVLFTVSDPYKSTDGFTVDIELRIHVYPSDLESKTVSGSSQTLLNQLIIIDGVTASRQNGAYEVPIVTKPGQGGLIEDVDAGAARARYSVTVYSMLYEKPDSNGGSGVAGYSFDAFGKLTDSEKEELVIASHIFGREDYAAVATNKSFATSTSRLTHKFIESISFSDDGSVMYVMPKMATNGSMLIYGDNKNEGFQLYVKVEKYINRFGSGDYFEGKTDANSSAAAAATVRVRNSTPIAVEVSDANFNARGDGNSYFEVSGFRGDSWKFLLYNSVDPSVALFTDPDSDVLSLLSYELTDIYTLTGNGSSVSYFANSEIRSSAADAVSITAERVAYRRAHDPQEIVLGTFNGFNVSVNHKMRIDGIDAASAVYLKYTVSAYDIAKDSFASRDIIVGINNSEPIFVRTDKADERYFYGQNDYRLNDDKSADLTLVLNREPNGVLETNSDGWLEVPLLDLIEDKDYGKNDKQFVETFKLITPNNLPQGIAGLGELSGKTNEVLAITDGESEIVEADGEDAAGHRFNVTFDYDKLTLLFKTNTYDRGKSDQVAFIVADSTGAVTGVLTITLVVGNAAPENLTQSGVSNRIVLEGGEEFPDGATQFESVRYSLFDYVTDKNPCDVIDYSANAPTEAVTYLTITGITLEEVSWHPSTPESQRENGLVAAFVSYGQYFTVTPLPKLYGTQKFILTISDSGNAIAPDSNEITLELIIQINPNPSQTDVFPFEIYWKRNMPLTPKALYDNPETEGDESTGYVIKNLVITNNPDNAVEQSESDGVIYLFGKVKERTVRATATVAVGDSGSTTGIDRQVAIIIKVIDNGKPNLLPVYITTDKNGKQISKTVYISKDDISYDDEYVLHIDDLFIDDEGDDLQLVSAKSVKSSLIKASIDAEQNAIRFRFKGKGTTDVEVKVRDAVSTYTYNISIGTEDLPEANFFIGMISRIQSNPLLFWIIFGVVLLLIVLLIIIILAAVRKKRLQDEIDAILVSEMMLEEKMLQLAGSNGAEEGQYLPPPEANGAMPNQIPMQNPNQLPPQNGIPDASINNNNQLPPPSDNNG